MPLVLTLLLSLAPAVRAAPSVSSTTVRLVLVEHPDTSGEVGSDEALERLLSESSGTIISDQVLPCYYADGDFRFRIPDTVADSTTASVAVLESETETTLVYPPVPGVVEGIMRLAQDPATYHAPWALSFSSRAATLSLAQGMSGEEYVSLLRDPNSEAAEWRDSYVNVRRVVWRGRQVTVASIGRIYGGLGRMVSAINEVRRAGPYIGVSRGGVFGDAFTERRGQALLDALAGLGLKVSGVGSGELEHWKELQTYRRAHPEGVQFVSANLVYSSATAKTLLPDHAVVEAGGLRIVVSAITPPLSAKYLPASGIKRAKILSPLEAVESHITVWRAAGDVVVLLADLPPAQLERLTREGCGVDLILADTPDLQLSANPGEAGARQPGRRPFDPPFWTANAYPTSLNSVALSISGGDWTVRESHRLLDDSLPSAPGFSGFAPERYGIEMSTQPPLLPAASAIFKDPSQRIDARGFWRLAAGLLAEETGSEAALTRVFPLPVNLSRNAPIPEDVVRTWLQTEDPAVVVWLRGSELKPLIDEARSQDELATQGLPIDDRIRYTAGGIDADGKIHSAAIDDNQVYKVAMTQVLADGLDLSGSHQVAVTSRTVDELVLSGLVQQSSAPPSAFRDWMAGQPVGRRGLWTINVRDLSLNIQDTQVVRNDAFSVVPNDRIQGSDQFLVGGDLRTDANYLADPYRWSNTLEMEYAKTRLHPLGQPAVTNTTQNRIMLLTTGTRRAGTVEDKWKWLGTSWGPSMGVEYDSQFVPTPGLPRQSLISAYPGVQFYEGTLIKSMETSLAIKRDQSRTPPDTQYGFHTRWLLAKTFNGPSDGQPKLTGEFWANYFFLTHEDQQQDLRFESDVNLALTVPIRKYFSIAPFVDIYTFALKTQPFWGYSAETGISIGFSRLWKPQYEAF